MTRSGLVPPEVPILSPDQVLALYRQVFANAVALTEEAEILLKAGRGSRAYALGHLAHEEVAKCFGLLNIWIVQRAGGEPTWELFWRKWRNHNFKVQLALAGDLLRRGVGELPSTVDLSGVDKLPAEMFDQMRAVLRHIDAILPQRADLNRLRTDAIYVDFRDGKVIMPSEAISLAVAADMVAAARLNCDFVAKIGPIVESLLAIDHPIIAQLMSVVARAAEAGDVADLGSEQTDPARA